MGYIQRKSVDRQLYGQPAVKRGIERELPLRLREQVERRRREAHHRRDGTFLRRLHVTPHQSAGDKSGARHTERVDVRCEDLRNRLCDRRRRIGTDGQKEVQRLHDRTGLRHGEHGDKADVRLQERQGLWYRGVPRPGAIQGDTEPHHHPEPGTAAAVVRDGESR